MGSADPLAFHRWGTALLPGALGHGLTLLAGDAATSQNQDLLPHLHGHRWMNFLVTQNTICSICNMMLHLFTPSVTLKGTPTKLGLDDEVPARKEQGDTEHQPGCRIEQHIAPDAMGG